MTFDYVIVGAGSAACVLAYRLSADPSVRVLVLEAGARRPSLLRRALARATNWEGAGQLWPYETVPQPALHGRRIYLPQGKVFGGGSAVNAMTYIRGHPDDYARWQEAGNTGWDPATVLAAFKRLEHNHSIADEFHGRDGPLDVSDQVSPHRLTRAFVDTARELGLPETRDFNGATQEGLGFYQVTQRKGRRRSAADAFLHSVRSRRNLTVRSGACATRIVIAGGRAVGVEFRQAGRPALVRADAGVIVS
ncbi:MAG TPA: GMC family oxidoreductase N-terminal domain-containing protein, partial [Gemmatimonadales bacterium]